jgi:hypothetical protein
MHALTMERTDHVLNTFTVSPYSDLPRDGMAGMDKTAWRHGGGEEEER